MDLARLILSNERDPAARGVLTGHCRVEALPLGRTRLHLDGLRLSLDVHLTPAAAGSPAGALPPRERRSRWLLVPLGALLVGLLGWQWRASWQPVEAAATARHELPTPGGASPAGLPSAMPVQQPVPLPAQLPQPPPEGLPLAAPAAAQPRVTPLTGAERPAKPPAAATVTVQRRPRPASPGAPAPARSGATTRAADADLLDLFGDTK